MKRKNSNILEVYISNKNVEIKHVSNTYDYRR